MARLWFWLLVCGLSMVVTNADFFTAVADLESLLTAEERAMETVDRYLNAEFARLDALKRYAKEQASNGRIQPNGSEPLNRFLTIKRMHQLQNLIKQNTANDYLKQISEQRQQLRGGLPTDDDAIGAAMALFRLQDTYKLESKELADGLIGGVKSSRPLTARECFDLGKVAYEQEETDFYHTLLWMQEADRRLSSEKKPTIKREEILDYLTFAMYEQDNMERALVLSRQLKRLDPTRNMINENIDYYERTLLQSNVDVDSLSESNVPKLKTQRDLSMKPPWFVQYETLCRGEKSLSKTLRAKLNCYYKQNRPFLRLARLKVEVMHLQPKIVLFKEAVSDAESEIIKKIAAPRFERGGIVRASGKAEASEKRTSKIGWIQDHEHDAVRRLSKRVEDMTDMTCSTAEYLQIANYGIGGHYESHLDFTPEDATPGEAKTFDEWGAGNRIATVLFYLSQPLVGGATIFTDLNLTVPPSKNDAIFWNNLLKSGKGDMSTRHAACPVLSGVKWVANKWLHEYGQEFHRSCSLDKNEYE